MLNRRETLALPFLLAAQRAFAQPADKGLFWKITHPQATELIIFGYGRVNASRALDIVADGQRLISGASRILVDLNPNIVLPEIVTKNVDLPSVMPRLRPETAERLRAAAAAIPNLARVVEKADGLLITIALVGEGQPPGEQFVAVPIIQTAADAGKLINVLLSDETVKKHYRPPDLVALARRVDDETVDALLDIRDEVGPIGANADRLYAERRGRDVVAFGERLTKLPLLNPDDYFARDMRRDLRVALNAQLGPGQPGPIFAALPIGLVVEEGGLLSFMAERGAQVEVLA